MMHRMLFALSMLSVSMTGNAYAAPVEFGSIHISGSGINETLSAYGELSLDGTGFINSTELFLGAGTWSGVQATGFMDNTGQWSGDTGVGSASSFDYDDEIAAMDPGQFAVGLYMTWNSLHSVPTAVLAVFDCVSLTIEGSPPAYCVSAGPTTMDNGPFIGLQMELNPVPVPAAVWLMSSGLIGLASMALRRRMA